MSATTRGRTYRTYHAEQGEIVDEFWEDPDFEDNLIGWYLDEDARTARLLARASARADTERDRFVLLVKQRATEPVLRRTARRLGLRRAHYDEARHERGLFEARVDLIRAGIWPAG